MKTTPENITQLLPNQIFVFGSNALGNHAGGAARVAVERFGALNGVARGPQGQSWAIVTLNTSMLPTTLQSIEHQVHELHRIAKKNPNYEFLVTKIGCGIAGFDEQLIAPLFADAPNNVVLPRGWVNRAEGGHSA